MQHCLYKLTSSLLMLLALANFSCAQSPSVRPHCTDKAFDKEVAHMLSFTITPIGPSQLIRLQQQFPNLVILDAREKKEFDVSHIEGAQYIGYDDFNPSRLANIPKNTPIVTYCSIGYRSEKIGEKLKKLGYSNVYNLYGSIFEWINEKHPVVDLTGKATNKVHTYNQFWSRWVLNPGTEKIF